MLTARKAVRNFRDRHCNVSTISSAYALNDQYDFDSMYTSTFLQLRDDVATWQTSGQLSPFPGQAVLVCNDYGSQTATV